MTKKEKAQLAALLQKFKIETETIAASRHRLRDLYDDIEAVLDSTGSGLEDIRRGVDTLSEYL